MKVNVTGFALWLALSVALKVIVLLLRTSSAVVLISIVLIFSVSVSFTLVAVTFELTNLLPYFFIKSEVSRLTCLSSVAVTVNLTVSPSTTVTGLSGEIVNLGGCVSGASVGVTGSLLSDFTVPLLLVTTVSAVIGVPGRASVTVTVAVPPLVFPVPISLLLPS